jgi:pimeloyl-ACP methyl ester carboxylesterase
VVLSAAGGGRLLRVRPPHALDTLVDRFDAEVFDAPAGRARLRLRVEGDSTWDAVFADGRLRLEPPGGEPDAELGADSLTWATIETDFTGGLDAYRRGDLALRRNLHLGVAFLAATSGDTDPGRLRFETIRSSGRRFSILEAGTGEPLVMLHGLGGTKVSFLPTVAALADRYRTIAVDLPGFGDSGKPFGAAYDPAFFAESVVALLDELGLERTHLLGHSMGGRAALEVAFEHPDRIAGLVLVTPSLAWLRSRPWARYLRLLRPELGLLQPAPRAVVGAALSRIIPNGDTPWVQAALDEFMRAYLTPRGRADFPAAAPPTYPDEPEGPDGFWPRLQSLGSESLFVWGREDQVVPIGFARHVRRHVPHARHIELACGHVPQIERPARLHGAIADFLGRHSSPRLAAVA